MSCTARRSSTPTIAGGTRPTSSRLLDDATRDDSRTPPSRAAKPSPPSCRSSSAPSCRRGIPKRLLRRQRLGLSLPAPRARVRQARRDPHPRPPVFAPRKGKIERWFRTVRLSSCPRSLEADTARPRRAQSPPLGLDRGRVSRHAAPRPRRTPRRSSAGPPRPPTIVTLPDARTSPTSFSSRRNARSSRTAPSVSTASSTKSTPRSSARPSRCATTPPG